MLTLDSFLTLPYIWEFWPCSKRRTPEKERMTNAMARTIPAAAYNTHAAMAMLGVDYFGLSQIGFGPSAHAWRCRCSQLFKPTQPVKDSFLRPSHTRPLWEEGVGGLVLVISFVPNA